MAQDPGIGYRVRATITSIKGECGAGHQVGESFDISCHDPGGLCGWFYHDMVLDFCGLDIGMAHQFLDDADVDPVFEHVGGKRVPEGMAAHALGEAGPIHRHLERLLKPGFEHVVPSRSLGARIHARAF